MKKKQVDIQEELHLIAVNYCLKEGLPPEDGEQIEMALLLAARTAFYSTFYNIIDFESYFGKYKPSKMPPECPF